MKLIQVTVPIMVLQPYKENIIKLTQNTNDGQAHVKSINYLLGHAPTFNISPDTNPLISSRISNNKYCFIWGS